MKKLVTSRPDIAFYIKVFLLKNNPEAHRVATSIVCSKSPAMLQDAYEKKSVPKQECGVQEVDDNIRFAGTNGINAAPAIIFPDRTVHFGFLDAAKLGKRIDEAVQKQAEGTRQAAPRQ